MNIPCYNKIKNNKEVDNMLFMTIIIGSRKYNFYIKNEEYFVTYTDNEYIHYLIEEQSKELLKFIFPTNLNYSYTENGYEIYLDKMGNKRYFRAGKEKYGLFFLNNGESALLSLDKEKNKEKKESNIKKIILDVELGILIFFTTYNIAYTLLRLDSLKYKQPDYTQIPIERIEVKEAVQLIDDSPNLDLEEKQYFKNIEFLVDVLTTAEPSRAEELRQKLTDIGILNFTKDELEDLDYANWWGYYNDIVNNNKIHLRDNSYFDYAAAHEFVHLCQDPSCPSYIREACAEMMAHEYFDTDLTTYIEARENIAYLMEIIGPKPVMECNFKGDTSSFRMAIRKYLSNEDTIKLMNEFYKLPETANHEEIKQLLVKMADKKFENQSNREYQKQQIALRSAHRSNCDSFYFNQHSNNYFIQKTAYYEVEEVYDRRLDSEIEELLYSMDLQTNEIKEAFEDERNNDGTLYIDFQNPPSNTSIKVKEFKERYPDDYYQFFLKILEEGGESFSIVLQRKFQDSKEITSELDNAKSGIKYYAYTADDCLHITVDQNGNYTMIRHLETEMPSVDTLFPEQTTPHPAIEPVNDKTTFTPVR